MRRKICRNSYRNEKKLHFSFLRSQYPHKPDFRRRLVTNMNITVIVAIVAQWNNFSCCFPMVLIRTPFGEINHYHCDVEFCRPTRDESNSDAKQRTEWRDNRQIKLPLNKILLLSLNFPGLVRPRPSWWNGTAS